MPRLQERSNKFCHGSPAPSIGSRKLSPTAGGWSTLGRAVEDALKVGAKAIAVTCNPDSPLEGAAELAIVVETGPEVVAGSTRMKAGTAEQLVLNMLSTGALVRLGYVYGNLVGNLHQKNSKLAGRAVTIVERALGVDRNQARKLLRSAANSVPTAIV